MENKLFSNFVYPVSLMKSKNNSVIIDTASFFEILRSSTNLEVGKKYASNVVESLRSPMEVIRSESPKAARKTFAETIKNYFRACGWGLLSFDPNNDKESDLFDVSTVVIGKIPELLAGQKDVEGEDGLSSPWVGFLKGFVSGLLQAIAPENDDSRIVGQSFDKYERTLTFIVSRNNKPPETEISLVHKGGEEESVAQTVKEKVVPKIELKEDPPAIQLSESEEKSPCRPAISNSKRSAGPPNCQLSRIQL